MRRRRFMGMLSLRFLTARWSFLTALHGHAVFGECLGAPSRRALPHCASELSGKDFARRFMAVASMTKVEVAGRFLTMMVFCKTSEKVVSTPGWSYCSLSNCA